MIRRSRETLKNGVTPEMLASCAAEHMLNKPRLDRLDSYYRGTHDITKRAQKGRWAPNNKIVNGFPKNITDTCCGYVFGNAIAYRSDSQDIERLTHALRAAEAVTHDAEMGKDLSVFGRGIELIYMTDDDNPEPRLGLIDPRDAFIVYDDSVMSLPMFGALINTRYDEKGEAEGYDLFVYTRTEILQYRIKDIGAKPELIGAEEHYFGGIPLIEYYNNEEGMGDFENVISLIDAYDLLTSDRLNDKERFVDAILLLTGAKLPEDDGESASRMLISRILELPEGAEARYITKTLNETETQILADSLACDIHKFSMVPDFTDERFSGNASGVALKYKLLALENLAKIKERFFISGLKERLRLFSNILGVKGSADIDINEISIRFNRTLPANDIETAQVVNLLKGLVPEETLLGMLPLEC